MPSTSHKDVDGFNPENLGLLAQRTPRLRPCTPYGCMKMLEHVGIDPKGMDAVVLGQSNIVGRPAALELLMRGATITVCHSQTKDLVGHVKRADIVVAGVGKPEFVKGEWDQARRHRAGRGHQPPAFRQGGGRCGVRDGERARVMDHAGAGRCRTHDHRHADPEHARGVSVPRRTGRDCRARYRTAADAATEVTSTCGATGWCRPGDPRGSPRPA